MEENNVNEIYDEQPMVDAIPEQLDLVPTENHEKSKGKELLIGIASIGSVYGIYMAGKGIYKGGKALKDKISNARSEAKKKISKKEMEKYQAYREFVEKFESEHPEIFEEEESE